jgi:hypothetical protein
MISSKAPYWLDDDSFTDDTSEEEEEEDGGGGFLSEKTFCIAVEEVLFLS